MMTYYHYYDEGRGAEIRVECSRKLITISTAASSNRVAIKGPSNRPEECVPLPISNKEQTKEPPPSGSICVAESGSYF